MRPRSDTLLVWTGAPCVYGCRTCPIDPTAARAGFGWTDLRRILASMPAADGRLVVLVGGEPFLRPDYLRLVAGIRAAGCLPGFVTTGRALVYPQVREKLRRGGVAFLRIQVFGIGEEHDRAVGVVGAYEQVLSALRDWTAETGPACDVDVALTIRGRPLTTLVSEIEALARALPSPDVQIIVDADTSRLRADGLAQLQQAAASLSRWNDDATRPLLAWEGLPTSVAAATSPLLNTPLTPAFIGDVPQACCLGSVGGLGHTNQLEDSATRANSFNFLRCDTSVPRTADAEACTAYRASGGVDPPRHLWLIDGNRLVLYATDTGDFASAEIARVKDEWSHLFLDRQAAGVLDDFTEGMRRVLPDPTCETCSHRAQCGRRFRVVEGAPFAREEEWISTHVAGLSGRVLDVGCGEQLYRSILAPLLSSGTVRYTGLDPDEPSLAVARAALPEGRFRLGGIEDFWAPPASYDHILCLRSLNHVFDVDEALARMAAMLRPGGSLLLVETTPFAMLRGQEQVAAADRAPRAGHQHFRNVSSEEVLPSARRRGLRVVHHHPVGLQSTNEWILLLQRA